MHLKCVNYLFYFMMGTLQEHMDDDNYSSVGFDVAWGMCDEKCRLTRETLYTELIKEVCMFLSLIFQLF